AQQARHHLDQGRLAGAVGPEQADDAAAEGPAHVAHAEHVPVPLRAALDVHHGAHQPRPTPACAELDTSDSAIAKHTADGTSTPASAQPSGATCCIMNGDICTS